MSDPAASPPSNAPEAAQLCREIGIFDLHCDTLLRWKLFSMPPLDSIFGADITVPLNRRHYGQNALNLWPHSDIPGLRAAGYRAALFGIHSIYAPPQSNAAWNTLQRQIGKLREIAGQPNPPITLARENGAWESAADEGRLVIAPAIEGAHMLRNSEGDIDELARLGVAVVTLCHLRNNWAATCSYTPVLARLGFAQYGSRAGDAELEPAGLELIRRLLSLGIAPDLAHVNSAGLQQACELLRRLDQPALCTHTGYRFARSAPLPERLKTAGENERTAFRKGFQRGDPTSFQTQARDRRAAAFRNLSWNDAQAIKNTGGSGGVIGVLIAPMYLAREGFPKSSQRVAEHIKALIDDVGDDHVAIGTDYDGMVDLPEDQAGCEQFHHVVAFLLQILEGTSQEKRRTLEKILFRNAARVLGEIWERRDVEARRRALSG